MFIVNEGMLSVLAVDSRTATVPAAQKQEPIKTPYGNLYPVGSQLLGILEEYLTATSQKRRKMSLMIGSTLIGVLLDSKSRLFIIVSNAADTFRRVIQLNERSKYGVAVDAEFTEMINAGLLVGHSNEQIIETVCSIMRFAKAQVAHYKLTDVINEMVSEGRTDSVFDHIADT